MKYFRIKEFASPDDLTSGKNMDVKFLRFMDELRTRCKFPFIVTSGYRTPEHNKKVGGIETSAHLKGLACDIAMTDSKKRARFVYEAMNLCSELALPFRIGLAGKDKGNFAHIDIDKTKKSPKIWIY
tara:strand:+ start:8 stop:388 length:381 start_codon:yes stop_codon:yes gene_type:complete